MLMSKDKKNTGKRKEMKIVLKSKPLNSDIIHPTQFEPTLNSKPKDARKKGTRGPSWIG